MNDDIFGAPAMGSRPYAGAARAIVFLEPCLGHVSKNTIRRFGLRYLPLANTRRLFYAMISNNVMMKHNHALFVLRVPNRDRETLDRQL